MFENICEDSFWDANLTWHTNNPDFTPCFHNTVLVWIPCGYLWIALFFELHSFKHSKARGMPWSALNISKTATGAVLVVLAMVNVIRNTQILSFFSAEFITTLIKFVSYVFAVALVVTGRKYGIRFSSVQVVFWCLGALSGAITLRSILMGSSNKVNEKYNHFVPYVIEYASVCLMLILSLLTEKKPIYQKQETNKPIKKSPEEAASFFSHLTFWWMSGLMLKGYRKRLKNSDVFNIPDWLRAEKTNRLLEKTWIVKAKNHAQKTEHTSPGDKIKEQSLFAMLAKTFARPYIFAAIVQLISDLSVFLSPLLIKLMIEFTTNGEPIWKGFFYAILLFASDLARNLCVSYRSNVSACLGSRIRTSLTTALYKKTLRLSSTGRRDMNTGELLNFMALDSMVFKVALGQLHLVLTAPIQILVASVLLWNYIGISSLAGIAALVLFVPLNMVISSALKKGEEKAMHWADKRVKMMNELLSGIRVIKFYAWERSYQRDIQHFRDTEGKYLKISTFCNGITQGIFKMIPILVTVFSFTAFSLSNDSNVLTPTTAFVCLRLFDILSFPIVMFPQVIYSIIRIRVSLARITKALTKEELKTYVRRDINANSENALEIINGSFSWSTESDPILKEINMSVPKGSLVAVVGRIASGKSSLLSACLDEMEKLSGDVVVQGTLAYVPQQAWIQNETLRNNIIFHQPMDQCKYEKIIDACALNEDIDTFPAYDHTEIGEKGINLSGGQKQRVSLARATYLDRDIYLMDDPLGAVDANTAKHIFHKLIGPKGLLKNKTRILVTHNLGFLPKVDMIYVIKDGQISESGTYDNLFSSDFFEDIIQESQTDKYEEYIPDTVRESNWEPKWKKITLDGYRLETKQDNQKEIEFSATKNIIAEEKISTAKTPLSFLTKYMKTFRISLITLIACCLILQETAAVYSNYWLAMWSDDSAAKSRSEMSNLTSTSNSSSVKDTSSTRNWLSVYAGLSGFQVAAALVAVIVLALTALRASMKMHAKILFKVLRSPMSYFDTTPVGRIINRFSKDLRECDQNIPRFLFLFAGLFSKVLALILSIVFEVPISLIGIVVLVFTLLVVQRFFIKTSSQLNHLSSASISPLFTLFSDTLSGSSVIRSLGMAPIFIKKATVLIDQSETLSYHAEISYKWMVTMINFLGSLIILTVSVSCVFIREAVTPGITGYVLNNAIAMVFQNIFIIYALSTLESSSVCLERIYEYFDLPSEADWNTNFQKLSKKWPKEGKICFWQYSTRYREGLDNVLRDVSFVVNPMEKVGVVGRTGAGKSSLTMALFRLIEPTSGEIIIDGVNIRDLGLHDLRSKITIIPQDPVLFSGTLRRNLDPFDAVTDDELWTALEHSHLKHFVKAFDKGLLHEVEEGGQNFSVGQRQLVCLARALLRKTKILVLDEATASVDIETDDLIQSTIRKEFETCTILTIAHRINTILDYDRVLVLSDGTVAEFDKPDVLLRDPSSLFYSLAQDAGLL